MLERILELIHALAIFEKEEDAVRVTEGRTRARRLWTRPCLSCIVAEEGGL